LSAEDPLKEISHLQVECDVLPQRESRAIDHTRFYVVSKKGDILIYNWKTGKILEINGLKFSRRPVYNYRDIAQYYKLQTKLFPTTP
jgi:hypothetical protein